MWTGQPQNEQEQFSMELIILVLVAIPIAAAGVLIFVHRSSDFKKLMRTLIISGVVCGIIVALLVFSAATVPIAPYETGRGAWTPVITTVAVAFLEGFSLGVLIVAAIGFPILMIQSRRNKAQST
jgi:hypothetical protein